jgi:hypothetical protein
MDSIWKFNFAAASISSSQGIWLSQIYFTELADRFAAIQSVCNSSIQSPEDLVLSSNCDCLLEHDASGTQFQDYSSTAPEKNSTLLHCNQGYNTQEPRLEHKITSSYNIKVVTV